MRPATLAAFLLFAAPAPAAPQMALTFDDLPAHAPLPPGVTRVDVAKSTIGALKSAKVRQAYGMVNSALLASEPESAPVLRLWREAGFPLGNHTWSHMNLGDHSIDDYQAEIVRNEPVLAELAEEPTGTGSAIPIFRRATRPKSARRFAHSSPAGATSWRPRP